MIVIENGLKYQIFIKIYLKTFINLYKNEYNIIILEKNDFLLH